MQIVTELLATRRQTATATVGMSGIEDRFVTNWGALARVFGMDEGAGRVHATIYLADGPVSVTEVAARLNCDRNDVRAQLEALTELGVVHACSFDDGSVRFEAERDPWSWFMRAIRERGRRDVAPVLASVRELHELAREAAKSSELGSVQRARLQHIVRFSQFVEQIACMLDTVMSMGAGPLMATMKMASRLMPRG